MSERRSWATSLASGSLAGMLGGLVFLGVGLLKSGADLFETSPYPELAGWLIARSAGFYALLFAAAGATLTALLRAVSTVARRAPWPSFPWVFGAAVAGTAFAYTTVWWQVEVLWGLPLRSAGRWEGALRHASYAAVAGLVTGAFLTWMRRRWPRSEVHVRRDALASLAAAVLLVVLGEVGLARVGAPDGGPGRFSSGRPGSVVVVGLDGLTFRVLSPMLRDGELPAFRRLLEEGAWGSLLTYGTASSPLLWTSMATGKRVRDHGIDDFVHVGEGSEVRPMKSFDRKSRAIWNILSLLERKVAVVNWKVTFPPEKVHGYMVPRLGGEKGIATYPAALGRELEPVLERFASPEDSFRGRHMARIGRTFAVARHLLAKESFDFLAVFSNSADAAQHLHWKEFQPECFDAALWGAGPGPGNGTEPIIPEIYRRLDHELGVLLEALPGDALVIVVSDHGQRPRPQPRVRLRLNRVLAALGHTRLKDGDSEEVDPAGSNAYALMWTYANPRLRINANLRGREPSGIVGAAQSEAVLNQVIADLRSTRLGDGTRLFGEVARRPGHGSRSDVRATLSEAFLARIATRGAELLRAEVVLGGRARPLVDFLDFNVSLSGTHDRQGVIFLRGPGVKPGPIGPRSVTTAIQEVVWRLTDKVEALDSLLPLMARIGLIERATTLDLTPTVLYALGLPVARDMAGRPRRELFRDEMPGVEWVATYEGAEGPASEDGDSASDEEVLKQLRSLGYIE